MPVGSDLALSPSLRNRSLIRPRVLPGPGAGPRPLWLALRSIPPDLFGSFEFVVGARSVAMKPSVEGLPVDISELHLFGQIWAHAFRFRAGGFVRTSYRVRNASTLAALVQSDL